MRCSIALVWLGLAVGVGAAEEGGEGPVGVKLQDVSDAAQSSGAGVPMLTPPIDYNTQMISTEENLLKMDVQKPWKNLDLSQKLVDKTDRPKDLIGPVSVSVVHPSGSVQATHHISKSELGSAAVSARRLATRLSGGGAAGVQAGSGSSFLSTGSQAITSSSSSRRHAHAHAHAHAHRQEEMSRERTYHSQQRSSHRRSGSQQQQEAHNKQNKANQQQHEQRPSHWWDSPELLAQNARRKEAYVKQQKEEQTKAQFGQAAGPGGPGAAAAMAGVSGSNAVSPAAPLGAPVNLPGQAAAPQPQQMMLPQQTMMPRFRQQLDNQNQGQVGAHAQQQQQQQQQQHHHNQQNTNASAMNWESLATMRTIFAETSRQVSNLRYESSRGKRAMSYPPYQGTNSESASQQPCLRSAPLALTKLWSWRDHKQQQQHHQQHQQQHHHQTNNSMYNMPKDSSDRTATADPLETSMETIMKSLAHAKQFQSPMNITEMQLVAVIAVVLDRHGELPIGALGRMIRTAINSFSLPQVIQDCGGIKAFLMRHDYIFVLGENHPNNPLVHLNKSGINQGKGEVSADPLILSMVNKV